MGNYLNPGSGKFRRIRQKEIYVDKSLLIRQTNKAITRIPYVAVSRPRRFGKSTAADMLAAYYDRTGNAASLFDDLAISSDEAYHQHLNQYNVIQLDITTFSSMQTSLPGLLANLEKLLLSDLKAAYLELLKTKGTYQDVFFSSGTLPATLEAIYRTEGIPFVFIIDEWDYPLRRFENDACGIDQYITFLSTLLKDKAYVELLYMTGILPVRKYRDDSILNMCDEISMTNPDGYSEFTGFTEDEVKALCDRYQVSYDLTAAWYDGYQVGGQAVYNPSSVFSLMVRKEFRSYWTHTASFEKLSEYITLNISGLREQILAMMAGGRIRININQYHNNIIHLQNNEGVLTLLVHLGYLTYEEEQEGVGLVSIPNHELMLEFMNCVGAESSQGPYQLFAKSKRIFQAALRGDEKTVADGLEEIHEDHISVLKYHDENSMAFVIEYGFMAAEGDYIVKRELAAGKGFADLTFLPVRQVPDRPPMVVELKWQHSAAEGMAQIKERHYARALKEKYGAVLLIAVNYDDKKNYTCHIEKI